MPTSPVPHAFRAPRNGGSSPALLKDRAYAELKRRIMTGEYPPESFLAERQLAEQLGMSKTPVKAALERLEHEGFISVSPQQGIVVRSMSAAEIADQYEIRVALETFTVRTLAGRLSAEQTERLRANVAAQKKLKPREEVALAVRLDAEFHTMFAEFLGNREILRVMSQLRDRMGIVIGAVFQSHPDRIGTSYAEHLAITEAVIRGDAAAAEKLIEEHLKYGKGLILMRRPE